MDLIKDNFLKHLWETTSEIFETKIAELEEKGELINREAGEDLSRQISMLWEAYHKTAVNQPRYIVISYLRTSLFDDYPWFQISMYDEEYLYSGRECSVWLDVPILPQSLSLIMNEVNQAFSRQTRVEEYYKDEFLITYGDKLYRWLRKRMRKITELHVFTENWSRIYRENEVSIMFGEYKNQLIRIY